MPVPATLRQRPEYPRALASSKRPPCRHRATDVGRASLTVADRRPGMVAEDYAHRDPLANPGGCMAALAVIAVAERQWRCPVLLSSMVDRPGRTTVPSITVMDSDDAAPVEIPPIGLRSLDGTKSLGPGLSWSSGHRRYCQPPGCGSGRRRGSRPPKAPGPTRLQSWAVVVPPYADAAHVTRPLRPTRRTSRVLWPPRSDSPALARPQAIQSGRTCSTSDVVRVCVETNGTMN